MRKLAEESQRAAAEISALVGSIQVETSRTVEVVQDGARRTEEGAAVVEQSSASTEQVSASTEETTASTPEIAASASELAGTAEALHQLVSKFRLTAESPAGSS